jgi:dipeptidyl aminopeptidase/acylaminoacyl peptidase
MATQVVKGTGYLRDNRSFFYRKPLSRDWLPLSVIDTTQEALTGFVPQVVDAATNQVFGFDDSNGFTSVYSIALDGSGQRQLVLGRSDVDVDAIVTIGRNSRVVGASYATERRQIEYFDPELKRLSASLSKALPGSPGVYIVDSSADESKLLISVSTDTNPGMYYLFDKASRKLEELLPARSELHGQTMATMKPITYPAADGTLIPGYLTLPPGSTGKGLPAIVMPHGGPSSRDEWGFDWLVQYFASRGFAVLQPNFRGSAGYGMDWYRKNGFKSWRTAVGDVNDAGRWLQGQGIAAAGKVAIFGWSYGGYAALQSGVLDPDLFQAIVAVAPVTDLGKLRDEAMNYANYRAVQKFVGEGPHVREGSPAQNAERIKAPVLMFHGDYDQNVSIGHSRVMESSLRNAGKQVTLVEFPELRHSLESGEARARVLSEADAFLRQALGLPAD